MIIYWPNKQSIELNLAVANLFVQTYKKFSQPISNSTKTYLPIDILNTSIKKVLFIEILIELEILVLDLTEINLSIENMKKLNNRIIFDLINKIIKNFLQRFHHKQVFPFIYFYSDYNKLFLSEHSTLIYQLLLYLIFGSSVVQQNFFAFHKLKTPFNHVQLLFENIIIQISNIVIFNLLESYDSIKNLSEFLTNNNICHQQYRSIRTISKFRNNLISYFWLHSYIHYPYSVYCSYYKIWFFSAIGMIYKHIYINRISDYVKLSKKQLFFILYLEMQDFILPKINYAIILLGQLITYTIGELVNQIFQICSQLIIHKINHTKR